MKTIKVPDAIHQELKRFVADNPTERMETVAGVAITLYLRDKGHKFAKQDKAKQKT